MALTLPDWQTLPTLDLRGPRGALTAAHARDLCSSVLTGGRVDYERVVFSTWALSGESAGVLGDVIRRLPRLRSLVLADIIAGRPDAEGIAVYRALASSMEGRQVEEVDLSDNAMGLRGVDACGAILKGQANLQRLYFNNNGISAEAARGIADLLLFRLPTQLRVLHLSNNMSGGGGAIALADILSASPHLQDFKFESSRGTQEGGEAIARALAATPALAKLSLHDNLFGAPTAATLAVSLAPHPHLRHLDLGDIIMKDGGMAALVTAMPSWKCGPHLQLLDVADNELGVGGAKALGLALARFLPSLITLRAGGNEFGEEGGAALCAGLVGRKDGRSGSGVDPLADVLLNDCSLGSGVATEVVRVAVATLPSLRTLNVTSNDWSAQGVAAARGIVAGAGLPPSTLVDPVDGEGEEDGEGEGEERAGVPSFPTLPTIEQVAKWATKVGGPPGVPTPSELKAAQEGLAAGELSV